jgi:hypothetical protein
VVAESLLLDVAWDLPARKLGISGNQAVARYKLAVGRRINSATLIADARHSWLDALSSAGAMAGLDTTRNPGLSLRPPLRGPAGRTVSAGGAARPW